MSFILAGGSVGGGEAAASTDPYDLETVRATSASRTPPTWVTDGTFQWPTAPTTSTSVSTTSMAELQTYVTQSNIEITVGAGFGSQVGSLTISGSDVDLIMSNAATIQGGVTVSGSRVRWTGGNMVGASAGQSFGGSGSVTDLLLDDVHIISNANANSFGAMTARLAVLNSTIDQQGTTTNNWAIYSDSSQRRSDWVFANVKCLSDGQNLRINAIDRLIWVDGANNPDFRSINTFRAHYECTDFWMADSLYGYGGFYMDATDGVTPGVQNGTFERLTVYGGLMAFIIPFEGTATISNSELITDNSNHANPINYSTGLTDGGGNFVTYDPLGAANPPDVSAIGAQR